MTVDRLIAAVREFETKNKGRTPAQIRVSNRSLRELLAETNLPVDYQTPVFSAQILEHRVITDWSLSDDEIYADWNRSDYGPRLQLSEVCDILRTWATLYGTDLPTDAAYKRDERQRFRDAWDTVELAISKSNMLARMFFSGDGIRGTPCPIHEGRWSGCSTETPCATQEYPYGCFWGCNITGWLPNPEVVVEQRKHQDAKEKDTRPEHE